MAALATRRSWRSTSGELLGGLLVRVDAFATGLVAAFAGAGVFVVGLADAHARTGGPFALLLFWPGILLIVAPATFLLLRGAALREVVAARSEALVRVPGAIPIERARGFSAGSRAMVVGALAAPVASLRRGRRSALIEDETGILALDLRGRIPLSMEAGTLVAATGRIVERRQHPALRVATGDLRLLRDGRGWTDLGHALRPRPGDAASHARGPATGRLADATEGPAPRRSPSRNERVAMLLIVGLALYLVKLMLSPLGLTGPDELTHWRTLEDILRSGHLFQDNPLLRISPIYPGLEAGAAGAAVTSGLGVFPIAIVLIAVAKLVTVLAVFLIASSVSGSARVAGVATVLYMANPSFLLFDAAFSYESLAIPLALVAIWAILHWTRHDGRVGLHAVLAAIAIAATAVTHHLTSLVFLGLLVTWAVVWFLRDRGRTSGRPIVVAVVWALACNVGWLLIAGTLALSYLSFIVNGGIQELISIVTGTREARQLFAPRAGLATPLPEVVVAYGAVLLLLASLPFLIRHALRSRRPPAIVVVLALAALVYPASLALRFTTLGAEVSQRASEFLFLPIGILGADWLVGRRRTSRRLPKPLIAPILLVIFAGGIVAGAPLLSRLPGTYLVAAEQRSVEPQGIETAAWVLRELGPDNRLIADRTNAKLLGAIGLQYPVTSANEHIGTAFVMFARTLGPNELSVMREARVKYVVVDLRLSTDLPSYPFYFESAEPDAGAHTEPIPIEALQKFEGRPGVTRVYDSGDIRIYDVSELVDAPQ
ncbi:MAG TPA: hypothetical protein VFP56_00040 [Candidatus Limnocylindrales bacterium]|nr:hypothetical protein [Candidatus Limnocylindrales bacterium]